MSNSKNQSDKKLRVLRRGGFSDRNGLVNINSIIQKDSLDERTRIALINTTSDTIKWLLTKNNAKIEDFIKFLYCDVLKLKSTQIPYRENYYSGSYIDYSDVLSMLDNIITFNPYEDVLTLVESIVEFYQTLYPSIQVIYNNVLESECVGYRLINGIMTDCISKVEISELEEVLRIPFSEGKKHIDKSMKLLFDKNKPDFENSIKESITAVEAVCQIIAGKKATLSNVLDMLVKKNIMIHPALKSAFEKIYGYTSDATGIRHADGFGSDKSSFEEAKYMLVSCSAFINYLIALSNKCM